MAKCGAEKMWHRFLKTTAKLGTKLPDWATRKSIDREWWWLFSCGPLVGCSCVFEASGWLLGWLHIFPGGSWTLDVGHNGNAPPKSAENDTSKNGFGPSNAAA
uniref:Uncharacterized protein n=1 Tax=Eutreptiella gymnastica TaxID=73025 RepID=A0A7S4GFJ2_9EUGL